MVLFSAGMMAALATRPMSRVWPSGLLRKATVVPSTPAAPGLLTTTTGLAKSFLTALARMRAARSPAPPAPKGQMMEMGPLGYSAWPCP